MSKIIGCTQRSMAGRREAFICGAKKYGFTVVDFNHDDFKKGKYDYVATFAWKDDANEIHTQCVKQNILSFHVECGYLKKTPRTRLSVTRNGIMAYGYHEYETNLPDDRWKKLNINLKPWRKKGQYILIAHQHDLDRFDRDRQQFFDIAVKEALKVSKNVVICTHPDYGRTGRAKLFKKKCDSLFTKWKKMGAVIKPHGAKRYIKNASCLITYDSNTSIESIVEGVPVVIYEKANTMARMVAHLGLHNLTKLQYPDRQHWCNWIAYQQWTFKEMESGLPFPYLLGGKK